MIASVHLADVGVRSAFAAMRHAPKPESTPGLRSAELAVAAPLGTSALPAPQPGRLALVAFWDGDGDVDRFCADDPLGAQFAQGWHVRLDALRGTGSWPGLPADLPTARSIDHDGPAAVLTLGRLRLPRAIAFLRASTKASAAAADSPGLVWGTALARPPFVATFSLWESDRALATYAYGNRDPRHMDAVRIDAAKPFHHRSAFVRFRAYGSTGHLAGRNPLAAAALPSEAPTDQPLP